MSGDGRDDVEVPRCSGLRVAVVATRWHAEISDLMLQRAEAALSTAEVSEPTVVRVAGVVELPVVCQELAVQHDAVVALGVVIRGGTPHFEYVCQSVTQGLTRVALDAGVAVGNGVLTVESRQQAVQRAGGDGASEDKGYQAAAAALDTALVLRRLRHPWEDEQER